MRNQAYTGHVLHLGQHWARLRAPTIDVLRARLREFVAPAKDINHVQVVFTAEFQEGYKFTVPKALPASECLAPGMLENHVKNELQRRALVVNVSNEDMVQFTASGEYKLARAVLNNILFSRQTPEPSA
jgi:Uncharacterized protein conserved in bacteria